MWSTRYVKAVAIALLCQFITISALAQSYQRAGQKALLSQLHHDVEGVVIIEDEDTIRVENFSYDGQGLAVYFYLGEENSDASFSAGLPIGPPLLGTVYSNDTLIIDLPEGTTLEGYNAISVWCVPAMASFGTGTFGSVVQYEVTFDATWSEQTHNGWVSRAHFSKLAGGTHDDSVIYWQPGGISTSGMEAMAERGTSSFIGADMVEIAEQGHGFGSIRGQSIIDPSPGITTVVFQAHSAYPLVTLVCMVAPSPDWFVGVSGLRLYEDGKWPGEVVVELPAYDAGTDSGVDFWSANEDTIPWEPISLITGFPFEGDPPLGTFTFRLICEKPPLGDINGDCRVDLEDISILASNWLLDCNSEPQMDGCQ